MYQNLLPFHSIIRWLLVACLAHSLIRSIIGLTTKSPYSKSDNIIRSLTSAISHIQLIVGFILYFKSPIVNYFRTTGSEALRYTDIAFFSVYHIALMVIAILLITIGAAKAKRTKTDAEKHKQIVLWFGIAALLIMLAIPWPFSPYVSRPYFRFY
jgi:nitric oxide reductase large subunit